MKCPICSYDRITTELRCPQCQNALTIWRNFDEYARQSFLAGTRLAPTQPATAAEEFLKAVVFAPEDTKYLMAYAGVLARLGRRAESDFIAQRAERLSPGISKQLDTADFICNSHSAMAADNSASTAQPGAASDDVDKTPPPGHE